MSGWAKATAVRFGSPVLRAMPFALRAWMFDSLAGIPGDLGVVLRVMFAKTLAASLGADVHIGRYCTVREWRGLQIGSRVSLHEYCFLHALGGINIGDDVSIAHATSIVSFEHDFERADMPIRDQGLLPKAISIGPDVWVGAGARVLAGVSLGPRTVVAAGAVVTRSHCGGAVLAGVPAVVVKALAAA